MVNQEWDSVEWIDDEIEVHQLREKDAHKKLKMQEKSLPLLQNGRVNPFQWYTIHTGALVFTGIFSINTPL